MPDGSTNFTVPMNGASAPVTITALGHHLGALRARMTKLDELSGRTPRMRRDASGREVTDLRGCCLHNAHTSAYEEVLAVEDLILESQASTLQDAAIQVMIANNRLSTINITEVDQDAPDTNAIIARIKAVERALWSVTKVCARTADIRLGDVGGDGYAALHLDPAPEIDVSGVPDDDPAEYPACDCPVPAGEV